MKIEVITNKDLSMWIGAFISFETVCFLSFKKLVLIAYFLGFFDSLAGYLPESSCSSA
jgi:hypothetical protein